MQYKSWELTKMAWVIAGILFLSALVLGFVVSRFFGEVAGWVVYFPLALSGLLLAGIGWLAPEWIVDFGDEEAQ